MSYSQFRLRPEIVAQALTEYQTTDISVNALAKKHGVDNHTMKGTLVRAGAHVGRKRPMSHHTPETKAKIVADYRNGESLKGIGRRYGISTGLIRRFLVEAECPNRDDVVYLTAAQDADICRQYQEGMSLNRIAHQYGVQSDIAAKALHRGGVSLRSKAEAYALRSKYILGDRDVIVINVSAYYTSRWKKSSWNLKRELPWKLTHADLESLYLQQEGKCYYTGIPLLCGKTNPEAQSYNNNPYQVSLDRRNSAEGYVPGNVVLCTVMANYAKNDWDEPDFKRWLAAIATNLRPIPCASDSLPSSFGLFSNLG